MTNEHTSTSSAGSEDSPSQPMLPGMIPESSASKTTTAQESSTDIGPMSQSSQTSETLTAASGEGQTSSQVDFLANHSVKPGSREAQAMTVTSGLKCSELLKKQDPVSCLQRMLLESSRWHSTMCFLNWKAKGTPQGRLLFQLAPSTPRTDEIECGLWPTPELPPGNDATAATTTFATSTDVTHSSVDAPELSGGQSKASALTTMWPTPSSRDWKDTPGMAQTGKNPDGTIRQRSDQLARRVYQNNQTQTNPGSLNPMWVEWLMGYPIGHTDLKHSETP